jgi:hypothetical protein
MIFTISCLATASETSNFFAVSAAISSVIFTSFKHSHPKPAVSFS